MGETLHQYTNLITLLSVVVIIIFLIKKTRKTNQNLPPSPPALPIIGHLHLLKQPVNQAFHKLSQKYGPIITLRLGSRLAILVSSPSAVEECLSKNDIIFANRVDFMMGRYVNYDNTALATASYGEHWRNLRRISTVEILSTNRLNKYQSIRVDEVISLLDRLHRVASHGFVEVNLRSMLLDLTTNVITRMVIGKRYYGEDVKETKEMKQFREIIVEILECSEITNLGDLFPIMEWFDFDGFKKRLIRLGEKVDSFLQGLIDEHRASDDKDTMINHLLSMQESDPVSYSDKIIKGLILILVLAGSETTATAIEWAIANLVNNPTVLKKAKAELDAKVGQDRLINESDLPTLNYLQNIIYENLRLYPVAPFLLPHFSSDKCTVGGYQVPANTMLLINAWAIQRDENLWDEPLRFKPERFEDGKVEAMKFLPFGRGRRACPGEGLANKQMGLALGALIQCFEWERIDEREIDMSEKTGVSMSKVDPLVVKCKSRSILYNILSPM